MSKTGTPEKPKFPKAVMDGLRWNIDRLIDGERLRLGKFEFWATKARQGHSYNLYYYDEAKMRGNYHGIPTYKIVNYDGGGWQIVHFLDDLDREVYAHTAWVNDLKAKGVIPNDIDKW